MQSDLWCYLQRTYFCVVEEWLHVSIMKNLNCTEMLSGYNQYFFVCVVKGIARSDEPTETYHPTLHFLSALQSILASFSSFFWFFSTGCVNRQLYASKVWKIICQCCFISLFLLPSSGQKIIYFRFNLVWWDMLLPITKLVKIVVGQLSMQYYCIIIVVWFSSVPAAMAVLNS